jgi:hypothetical protein
MICKECNEKLQERGILNNDQLCKDCRKMVEKIVESEVEKVLCEA